MNVNDFQGNEFEGDKLVEIFAKQRALMDKYEQIEEANGLLQTKDIPVNLDDRKGQHRLKDFFWRTTEEVAEALEAFQDGDVTHFREELADALHFLVEACILADFKPIPKSMHSEEDALEVLFKDTFRAVATSLSATIIENAALSFIMSLGLAANCLKNKPWKQSHMQTDKPKFYQRLNKAFEEFISLCKAAGFTAESLYDMYFRKNEVNKFRQRSGY